jgi:hypothetical protein
VESSPNSTTWPAGTAQTDTSAPGADQGAPILQQTRQKAGQMVDQARGQVMEQIDSQKAKAAGGLSTVAQALRQTGEQLQGQDQGAFGQAAQRAADAVERFSGYIEQRDARQLINEVEQFARSQPAIFLGSAFALGLLAARFFKSSPDGSQSMPETRFADLQSRRYVGTPPSGAWATAPAVTPPSARYDGIGMTAAPDAAATSTASVTNDTLMADTEDDEEIVPALGQRAGTRLSDDA